MNVVLRRGKCYEKIKQSKGTEKDREMGRDVDKHGGDIQTET